MLLVSGGDGSLIPSGIDEAKQKVSVEESVRESIMQYEVSVTEGQTWIYARVYDPITKTLALDLLQDVARRATKHGIDNLLIDARGAPSMKSSIEDYNIINYRLEELGFKRWSKSAIVVDPEDKTHHFFETCTKNAGYNWRVFSDADHATQWLDSVQPVS